MRCNNCFWFPMKESEEDVCILICPNCGYEHIEGPNENFIRNIYQEYLMDDKDEGVESLDMLQDEIKETDEEIYEEGKRLYKIIDEIENQI